MRFCEAINCNQPVFGTCKKSRKGYCKNHQTLREDYDKRSILQKAVAKRQKQIVSKVRSISNNENKFIPNQAKIDFEMKEQWFNAIRRKLSGTCQCGCGKPSSKNDDKYYRHSCCHLFPKNKFKTIQYHLNNYVERAFFGGCHSILDDTSMDRWPDMADWNVIVDKFHELAPLLTDEERTTKFYSQLERLIYFKK